MSSHESIHKAWSKEKLTACAIGLLKIFRVITLYTTVSHILSSRDPENWPDYVIKRIMSLNNSAANKDF